ncbi:hypothetical protein NLU13_9803 [Sarocladium strictum]|uniref:Uncharacterized protein n=1 Tax=Sarocladium strictum TaxID=5046 RepID=A0AA39GAR1_SARSR|nr:hypothetical protein NLU13_9803 [Sarocladium strictum]
MATSARLTGSQDQDDLTEASPGDEAHEPPAPIGRITPDIISGVYRGLRKLPSVRLPRNVSLPSLRRDPSPAQIDTVYEKAIAEDPLESTPQNADRVNFLQSLDKPLPQPPSRETYIPHPREPAEQEKTSAARHEQSGDPSLLQGSTGTPLGYSERIQTDSGRSAMDSSGSTNLSNGQGQYQQGVSGSMSSLASSLRQDGGDDSRDAPPTRLTIQTSAGPSPAIGSGRAPPTGNSSVGGPSQGSSSHLSGLMCNVHRTTGREPHPLVGATTTVLGDKLYVFGGRILSRSRPAPLTSDLYELDLIRRHWTKLETTGDIPPPRYFHSMCALGDTKMVCYGGMSPMAPAPGSTASTEQQSEVTVMSDIYIYDVPTRKWTFIPTQDPPQGRYAHCACILPSTASFSSHRAPLSALRHNPSSGNPNEGRIGINIDGSGGSEMIIVGGQDGANHYIEHVSVFNLRSLKWTATQSLGKSCGAYRSVAAALPPSISAVIGRGYQNGAQRPDQTPQTNTRDAMSSMLIYSNYNFLDVKLELQIRTSDGTLHERPMSGTYSPPGLRFPNGGVLDNHFVVSGTYLTSSKQEYALWALDLRTLTWSRIDAGGGVFGQGSWNRGVLWSRRNTFVILGNRKRSLVDDYNHRRINFSNVCMVELEAFGFYDNPRKSSPLSGFISASSPYTGPGLSIARKAGYTAGGRYHSKASEELGEKAFAMRELSDMDILCIGGERIPVNSRIVARRWGPYFVQLLREGTATQDGSDAATLRSGLSSNRLRASALTITPSSRAADSSASIASTLLSGGAGNAPPSTAGSNTTGSAPAPGDEVNPATLNTAPTPSSLPPNSRPRCLYLPHTYLTIQALLHFLYTSSLPPPSSPLCTPQILCSLLQVARPYRIDGLLEAVIERLHALLDSRNAAAVFNATAMAAGGGRGIDGSLNPNFFVGSLDPIGSPMSSSDFSLTGTTANGSFISDTDSRSESLQINTNVQPNRPSSGDLSASGSASGSEWSNSETGGETDRERNPIWNGELSSVIGLQKRGLRGLMEGRRMRERTGTSAGYGGQPAVQSQQQRIGLGIGSS